MSQGCISSNNQCYVSVMWKTISEACNLACDYCYYSRCGGQPSKIERIESSILEKFISEYMGMSRGVASFAWQGGEPLLAGIDFFKEVISLQGKYAPRNTIICNGLQTNATLLNDEWAKFFKQYNFLIGVSLDGTKEMNDARRMTGHGRGSFDRIMAGIDHLRNNDVDFNILTVIHEDNVGKAKELMEFYEMEGFSYIQFIPCMDFRSQESDKPGKYLITPEEYGAFLCETFDVWYNDGSPKTSIRFFDNMVSVYLHREAELCIHRQSCPKTLILEQNGDAYPCDFFISDEYRLGNVGDDHLSDILNSQKYAEFLIMKPNLPDTCKSCEYLKFCHGGCPRNRLWNHEEDSVERDYFCKSYKQIYSYAHDRMETLAIKVKTRWLHDYLRSGRKVPERNDSCICGSGIKFKKCCEHLRDHEIVS